MPILYQHQPDEAITWQKIAFDEEGGWWAGVRQCAATVALAAVLSATSLSTAQAVQVYSYHQDDPAGNLKANPEEQYWQNSVAPVPASLLSPQQWTFDVQEPAGSLSGQPDEDFWQLGPPSVPATLRWQQQWTFDVQEPAGSLRASANEEYWFLNPVCSFMKNYQQLPYGFDSADFIAAVIANTQNYVNTGAHNYISQEIGEGTKF